jgi:hypothetical protein
VASGHLSGHLSGSKAGHVSGHNNYSLPTSPRALPTPTLLTQGNTTTDATSFATASVSPVANRVVFAAVASCVNAAVPTCSGNGLTWEQVGTCVISTFRRLTVFRAIGASPSSGAITFSFGSSQTSACWNVIQFADASTAGTNGSGAVVQVVPLDTQGAATTRTNTLAALEHANNVHLCYVLHRLSPANVVPDAQFAELAETTALTDSVTLHAEWARGELACSPTWGSDQHAMLSIEVRAA